MDWNQVLNQQAQTDQAQAALENLARQAGTYYTALVKNGVPEELAAHLLISWHDTLLDAIFHQARPQA